MTPSVADPTAARAAPLVVAVTVNYNGGAFLGSFLHSFRALTYPNLRLVVVDNASTDGSVERVAEVLPEATVIRLPQNTGFCGGNNVAIREALRQGATWVLFINNDTRLSPDLVARLMAHAAPRRLVAPRVYLEGTAGLLDDTVGRFSQWRGAWRGWVYGKPPPAYLHRPGPTEMASLCCLLVPARLFHDVGLLDERLFMYYEDFDFVLRARRAGYRLWQTPDAVLWHRKSASSGGGDSAFKVYYATRNRLAVLHKHQPLPLFGAFLLYFLPTRAVRAVQWWRAGRRDLARAVLLGTLDFARGRMGRQMLPPVTRNHTEAADHPVPTPSADGRPHTGTGVRDSGHPRGAR